jgi:uncharacterized membrane protein
MRALLLIVSILAAGPACAFELSPRAQALLGQGRPYVEVRPDPDGSSGQIHAAIDIGAPVETVWAVMTGCEAATRMVPSLKSCRIVERDPQGRWDVREFISRATLLPPVRNVFRSDYEPGRSIRFHRTGGDLAVFEGEWRLEPRDGLVRVTYESRVAAPFNVPGALARLALRHDVTQALLAFRREALARAR